MNENGYQASKYRAKIFIREEPEGHGVLFVFRNKPIAIALISEELIEGIKLGETACLEKVIQRCSREIAEGMFGEE